MSEPQVEEIRLSKLINPTSRQREFLKTIEQHPYTLYGGAAGGGKSYILRWFAFLTVFKAYTVHGVRGAAFGLFCEDYPALKDRHVVCWDQAMLRFGSLGKSEAEGLRFKLKEEYGGGMILLRNLDEPHKYDSSQFCGMAVDEWTKNPWAVFDELRKRLRWPTIADAPHFPCGGMVADRDGQVVPCPLEETREDGTVWYPHREKQPWNYPFAMGSNPGGKAHAETKAIFIDREFPEHYKTIRKDFAFVQAKSADNPFNPADYYEKNLATLPEKMRKAYAEGDWTIFAGQYFSNFDVAHRKVGADSVRKLMKTWWPKWVSMDWGFKHASVLYWHTRGTVGVQEARELLGREWEEPREVTLTFREVIEQGKSEEYLAQLLVMNTREDEKDVLKRFFLSPDAFAQRTAAKTIAQQIGDYVKRHGLPLPERADDDRIGGWQLMYQMIEEDSWFISSECTELLKAIPVLSHDDVKVEDVMKTEHVSDDCADCARYGMKSMLRAARPPKEVMLAAHVAAAKDFTATHMAHLQFQDSQRRVEAPIHRPSRRQRWVH